MYMMVEQSLRGGISMVSKRYARANNPDVKLWISNKDLKSYLLYLDANNLYGWAIMQALPIGGFQWVSEYELEDLKSKINDGIIDDENPEGYIFRVKLRYPQSLHPSHTDYPLAVERMKVKSEWLSSKQ